LKPDKERRTASSDAFIDLMRQVLSFPRCPLQRGFASRDEVAAFL